MGDWWWWAGWETLAPCFNFKGDMTILERKCPRKTMIWWWSQVYLKNPNNLRNYPKIWILQFYHRVICPKDADGMANYVNLIRLDRIKRIWYLSPMRAAKVQASLRIRAVSPEPPLLAHTSSESRGTFRQKARSLASLNGWALGLQRYTHLTIRYVSQYLLHDTIRIAIRFSDLRLSVTAWGFYYGVQLWCSPYFKVCLKWFVLYICKSLIIWKVYSINFSSVNRS